jgi:2-oxoglutarate dehydrogenase E2 component (dihydrolipoamide succinyltransferase)
MAVEVKMPQLGESVHEGTIGKWLKAVGDSVQKYEPLLEVITDKVDTEVTAAESGTVLAIVVPEGETVKVGTVLAMIGAPGEDVEEVAGGGGRAVEAASVTAATGSAPESPVAEAAPATAGAAPETSEAATAAAEAAGPGRVSPVAARVAAEHGVDTAQVAGTGPGGQVTRADVERSLSEPLAPLAPAQNGDVGFISPRVARLAALHGVNLRQVRGTGRDGRVTARDVEAFVAAGGAVAAAPAPAPADRAGGGIVPGELVKLTPMRAAIAEHMVRSKHTSPHVTTVHEVDMSAVMAAYESLKPHFADKGVRLTLTAFVVRATADAIARHPIVNSSWADGGIQTHRDINIGLAVAVPAGLIVPVIRNADEKNLLGLARDVTDLAERARSKKLSPDDVQGGTFTLTNYGTLGSLFGTPVINQPQAAILGTGAIKKQPVVIEGPGGDSIGIKPMMLLALTFDHRILEGSTADPFVQDVVRALESEQGL